MAESNGVERIIRIVQAHHFYSLFSLYRNETEGSGLFKYGTQDDMVVNGRSGIKTSSACLGHLSSLHSIIPNID